MYFILQADYLISIVHCTLYIENCTLCVVYLTLYIVHADQTNQAECPPGASQGVLLTQLEQNHTLCFPLILKHDFKSLILS